MTTGRLARLAALAALAGAAPGRARAQEAPGGADAPPGYDAGVYDVRAGRGAAATLPALVDPRGGVLLPLRRVLALTGLAVEQAGPVLSVADLGGGDRVALDTASGRLTRSDTTAQLAPAALTRWAGEVYVDAPSLGVVLRAEVQVEPAELTVVVSRAAPFPAERDALVAARRAAVRAGPAPDAPHVPYGSASGGMVLDWGLSSAGGDPRRGSGADGRLGFALLGGELAAGGFYSTDALGAGRGRATASYRRVFPNAQFVRQLQLGDVAGGSSLLRPLRGAVVTNAPFVRDASFAQVPVLPEVPRGWQYEVYQSGQLVGYSDAASRAPVLVPLRYGTTPLEVRLLSPAGDEVVSTLLYQVPLAQLAPGAFEYSLGGGQCADVGCEAAGFATARYGVRRWLTAQAGLEAMRDTAGALLQPQAGVSAAALSGWGGQIQLAHRAFTRASVQYAGAGALSGSIEAGRNSPGSGQLRFVASPDARWYASTRLAERFARTHVGASALRGEWRVEGPSGGAPDRVLASVSADVRRGRVGLEHQRAPRAEGVTSGSLLVIVPPGAPRALRHAAVQTAAGGNGRGLRVAEASVAVRAGARGSLTAGWSWNAARRAGTASIVYAASLGFARTTARVTSVGGAGTQASSTLSGSAVLDRRVGATAVDQGGVGSAGIAGTVFYDNDGDGLLGDGDAPAPGARVFIAGGQVRADARGEYHAWHEQPYEIAAVRVDTLESLEPEWTPRTPVTLVRPTPHQFTRVDVPLVRTREVGGRVQVGRGVATAAGVTVVLVNRATGARQPAVTFSDGEYYLSRVAPGDYDVTVDPTSLRALGAVVARPPVVAVVPAQGADVVVVPTITLVPAAP